MWAFSLKRKFGTEQLDMEVIHGPVSLSNHLVQLYSQKVEYKHLHSYKYSLARKTEVSARLFNEQIH